MQPVPWISTTETPPLPPTIFPTSATPSQATTRLPEDPPTWRITQTLSESKNDSTDFEDAIELKAEVLAREV